MNNSEQSDTGAIGLKNEEEKAVEKALLDGVMNPIMRDWGLNANVSEFVHAIHTIQHFITMHALQREYPNEYSKWFKQITENK